MEYTTDHKRIVRLDKKVAALERCLSQYIGNRGATTIAIGQPLEKPEVLPLNDIEILDTVRLREKQKTPLVAERGKIP